MNLYLGALVYILTEPSRTQSASETWRPPCVISYPTPKQMTSCLASFID